MSRPRFRPTTRPLRPISYRRAARRFRQLADMIERYCEQKDAHERARLTRAIHGLAYAARGLSERHRRAAAAIPGAEDRERRKSRGWNWKSSDSEEEA